MTSRAARATLRCVAAGRAERAEIPIRAVGWSGLPASRWPTAVPFKEPMEAAVRRRAEDQPFAVLCLDLDRFKAVTETLGRPANDTLLCQVAACLRRCGHDCVVIVCLCGDELDFVVAGRWLRCST
jgi:hypothetical protein